MRKAVAGLLVFLFVMGFALQVAGRAVLGTLFSPAPYVESVRQSDFAEAAAQVVRDHLAAQVAASQNLGGWVSQEDVDWVAEQVVTGPWLSSQLEQWLQTFFDWLKSDAPEPTWVLSLAGLKAEVPALVEQLLVDKLTALPPCGADTLGQILGALLQGGEMPVCIPPGLDVEALVRSDLVDVPGLAAAFLQPLPDEINVLELLEQQGPDQKEELLQRLRALRAARNRAAWMLTLTGLVLIVLLLVIGLLRSRPRRALVQWWGTSFFLGGCLAVLLVGGVYAARETLWQALLASADGGLPTDVLAVARHLFVELVSGVWSRGLTTGGLAMIAGAGLGLLSLALPRGKASA